MSSLCHFLLSSLLLFGFTWSIMIDSFVVRIRSYRNDFLRLILADNIAVQVGSVFELIYVVKIQILCQEILFNIWPFLVFFGVGRSRRESLWLSSSLRSNFWASGRIWLRKSELQLLQTQNLAPIVNFDTWLKSGLLQFGQIGGLSETAV